MKLKRKALVGLVLCGLPVAVAPITYVITANDSSTVNFTMKSSAGPVEGRFRDFGAQVVLDRLHFKNSTVDFRLQTGSVATDDKPRDAALRSFQGLDSTRFPSIEFHSKSVVWAGKARMAVTGDLTAHGVTRSVTVNVLDLGNSPGVGHVVDTFKADFTIHPRDFGVPSNKSLDSSGTVLGDEVPVKLVLAASER